MMKKIYQEPKIMVVEVIHNQMLCTSSYTDPDVEHVEITDDEDDVLLPI